jgi:two-component system, OmpR family, phosphate regulon sensor histidine kinase PhoR
VPLKRAAEDESPMPNAAIAIALATGIAMALAGANPWLALGVTAIWLGTLWLNRPEPDPGPRRETGLAVPREAIAPFIESLGVPLLLLDGERIAAANRAAREALGAHIAGQDARIALRHPEAVALLADAGARSVTVEGLTGARSVWQLSRFDIDERHRLIEFVNRTAEADIGRAHTDFVANASHELRTPLSSIIGYLETLRDPAQMVDKSTQDRFLGTMESEARRMQALVEDLMSLSRIEAEKHDTPRAVIDLAAAVAGIGGDIAAVQGPGRVSVDAGGEPLPIAGEPVQIDQLVRNLVDNALKYGDPGQPVVLSVARKGTRAVLTVSDTGPGIAPEHLPHLTRRFYRTDPGRSRASGGTGLGLAIVKHIVERHRGRLDIASRPDAGTTVTVDFPLEGDMSQ